MKESNRPMDYWEKNIKRNENILYRMALSIMKNKTDAEDMVQETFLKYIEKNVQFDNEEHEDAWMMRVLINKCKSRLRTVWFKRTETLLDVYPAKVMEEKLLMEEIMALSEKYRTVIHLYYFEGYSTKEISYIIKKKESTVRSILSRGRARLKILLEEDNYER